MDQICFCELKGRELEDLAELFKALGTSSRIRILFQIVSSEVCVSDLADRLGMSESAVSHHLHVLRMNGLVRWRREGKTILYQLIDDHVRGIIAQGCKHIGEASKGKQF